MWRQDLATVGSKKKEINMRVLIKGAGDLATGVAALMFRHGFQIIMTEIPVPLTVRRQVAFSRAVYEGTCVVEDITAELATDYERAVSLSQSGKIAVVIDPEAKIREVFRPEIIVDGIMAKKNTGTSINDASVVIALGPGFTAGKDCHAVIETMRGENLGKPIYNGMALPNTGIPGMVGGYAAERLIKAAADGKMKPVASIGDIVKKGDLLALTGNKNVYAQIDGVIRGMLQENVDVYEGMKIGDVDPRCDESLVYIISDKSVKIGKGVLKAVEELVFKDCGICLLAAGSSTRFGSNKLLYEKNGKPLFLNMFDKMSVFSSCVKTVVTGYEEIESKAPEYRISVTENKSPEKGISESVKLGLEHILSDKPDTKAIMFAVCDQPELSEKTMYKLMVCHGMNEDKICSPEAGGKNGNPVIFGKKFFPELMELTGDTGGKSVIKRHLSELVTIPVDEAELKDLDYRL